MVQKRLLLCIGLVLMFVVGRAAFAMEARDGEDAREENQELVIAQLLPLEQARVVGPDKMLQEVLRMGREEYRKLFEMTEVLSTKETYDWFQASIDERPVWKGEGIAITLERYGSGGMQFVVCDGRYRVFIPLDTRSEFVSKFLSNPLSLQTVRTFSSINRHLIAIHKRGEDLRLSGYFSSRDYPEIGEYPEIKELISLLLNILSNKVLHSPRVASYDFERKDVSFSDVEIVCFDKAD